MPSEMGANDTMDANYSKGAGGKMVPTVQQATKVHWNEPVDSNGTDGATDVDGSNFYGCDGAKGALGADSDDRSVHVCNGTSIEIGAEEAAIYCNSFVLGDSVDIIDVTDIGTGGICAGSDDVGGTYRIQAAQIHSAGSEDFFDNKSGVPRALSP